MSKRFVVQIENWSVAKPAGTWHDKQFYPFESDDEVAAMHHAVETVLTNRNTLQSVRVFDRQRNEPFKTYRYIDRDQAYWSDSE